jgi:hypothetical protein
MYAFTDKPLCACCHNYKTLYCEKKIKKKLSFFLYAIWSEVFNVGTYLSNKTNW